MPEEEDLPTLHGRLIAGDLRAASKIVERVIATLVRVVDGEVAGLHDRQDVEEVCYDACLQYLTQPARYDPSRAQLITYLAAIAKGKAQTLRRSQTRRSRREAEFADRNIAAAVDAESEEDRLNFTIDSEQLDSRFRRQLIKDDGDAEVLQLMSKGEKSLSSFARALRLPDDEQGHREAGKRVERMRGRIRRLSDKTGG
ncbi:MAG TPA: sigma factor [Allosphingosinicella sp.]|nr:sigma factor [Allosphingosinicella sp.]